MKHGVQHEARVGGESAAPLAVVVPVRDRAGPRLDNCLRSIRWQEGVASVVEIVISDLGSEPAFAREIGDLAERHRARVVRTSERRTWNRARALNLGIQAATAPWILCTDADMILAPNFVATVLEELERHGGDALVLCPCHDLPPSVTLRPRRREEFEVLRRLAEPRTTPGTGACQAARRSFFYGVRGFDEKYLYWGAEDVDLSDRAAAHGLELVRVGDRTSMLHQWHPTRKHDRRLCFHLNRWRYWLTRHRVVKNRRRWGGIVGDG